MSTRDVKVEEVKIEQINARVTSETKEMIEQLGALKKEQGKAGSISMVINEALEEYLSGAFKNTLGQPIRNWELDTRNKLVLRYENTLDYEIKDLEAILSLLNDLKEVNKEQGVSTQIIDLILSLVNGLKFKKEQDNKVKELEDRIKEYEEETKTKVTLLDTFLGIYE